MDIATGRVIGKTNKRHRAKEFISFLNLIDNRMQSRKNKENIHIILDNSSTHKTKEVKEWLKAHPNYHFHVTPTSSSWLNAVENWFSRLEVKGLQRKAFQSVKQLREHLRQYIAGLVVAGYAELVAHYLTRLALSLYLVAKYCT